jgi:hypothetical protein
VALKRRKIYAFFPKLCIYFCLTENCLHAHFLAEFRGTGRNFGSCMRTTTMEDAQGSYNHEEEFRGLHVSMGNVETESNGRRGRKEPVTMRSLQREVQSYRDDNENIMKSQEEILQSLNMLQRQANKDSGTKPTTSARQVTTSRSHSRRDEHGNDRKVKEYKQAPSFPREIH